MVLRQVLHLDEPTGIASGAVGPVKLNQSSGTVIRADHRLHGGVFLDAALGKLLSQGEGELHLAVGLFEHICHGGFGERIRLYAFFGKPRLELHRTVGVIQAGHGAGLLHVRPLEAFIAADCLGDEGSVEHDALVVDLLVEGVVAPLGLGDRKLGELLLNGHFRFHISKVVGFEQRPFLRRICRIMSNERTVLGFCRSAEIPDKVFAFFELLLFETQHGTDAFQRKRQSQRCCPDHRAVPGGRVEILPGRVSEITGQAHTLELCIERPFGHGGVGQRRADIGGKCFSGSQIHNLHRSTVRRIAEKQHLEVRGFGIAVHTAFGEVLGGEGLNIDT